jgi:hypothetical protein
MIKKIVLTAAVAALAVSFASAPAFAKKHHKMAKKCTVGTMTTGAPNSMGWAPVSGCGMDGQMYAMPMMCYTPSGMCPK